jgi:hypothetical protein
MKKQIALTAWVAVLLAVSATAALAQEGAEPQAPPQWQQLFPPVSPPPRASHAMAYCGARGVAVLFGGG